MATDNELKNIVKEKYAEIATATMKTSCCGSSNKKVIAYSMINDDYSKLDGYVADADLNLGCGLPTEFAGIKEGDTVIDLGSGAGNDVFIARSIVGESGKVIGLDFTDEMLLKANKNNEKLGYKNVEFKLGEIENMPFENEIADVVVSNCVLNLVPDKYEAFAEIYRILKPGAHFCVSDIVIKGELNPELRKSAAMYAGCVSGALQYEEYLNTIAQSGFKNVEIKKTKRIDLPDDLLKNYLDDEGIKSYKENVKGILSITVVGYKA
jgi:ubiquinone/menaquinone biosynthesis C-methylase UbiE